MKELGQPSFFIIGVFFIAEYAIAHTDNFSFLLLGEFIIGGPLYVQETPFTVESPNKGHIGTRSFVLYREVSFIRRLKCTGIIGIGTSRFVLYREVFFIRSVLYRRFNKVFLCLSVSRRSSRRRKSTRGKWRRGTRDRRPWQPACPPVTRATWWWSMATAMGCLVTSFSLPLLLGLCTSSTIW